MNVQLSKFTLEEDDTIREVRVLIDDVLVVNVNFEERSVYVFDFDTEQVVAEYQP